MPPSLRVVFLLMLMDHAESTIPQNTGQELPPQLQKTVEEVIAGKYINALLDVLHFQSTNLWTADVQAKLMAYFHAQNIVVTYSNLQISVKNYLESLLYQPKRLLSEFQQMNHQRFQTAMKYLFDSKQKHLELGNIILDLAGVRERIFQSPGGNRTLFLATLEKCFLILNSGECVGILSQIVRASSINYLQLPTITSIPKDLEEDSFRNLTTVFRDLYDRISANTQKALYAWMTQILQSSYNAREPGNSTSWVSAENLWILGRYMVHLSLEEIKKINPNEMRLFISYDNATKQLDTVYDITPELAQAFLERINASGFDMSNTSTLYRLGLLVCFYEDLQAIDASVARVLLHQMMKCNQLRGFHADVQKLKSQFLDLAMQNQTLNDILGSLSDAVVGLTTGQLESLSPEAVQNAIPTLSQVSGWTKSQIMILSSKYLIEEKDHAQGTPKKHSLYYIENTLEKVVLSFLNLSQMGALMTGIRTQSFHSMNPKELSQAIRGPLAQHASELSPAQQQGILRKMITSIELPSGITDIQGAFFKEVSLFYLWKEEGFNSSLVKDKELRQSQALFLYELLSKTTLVSELLSIGQLVKGITCQQMENMSTISFLNIFKLFERNLHLLSPYQINCLAWKFWRVSDTTMPPYLVPALPAEFLESVTGSRCGPFVSSLGKVDLDHLILNVHKKKATLQKVEECLNGSVIDDYDIDLLGDLICHLPPALICGGVSPEAMPAALHQFTRCRQLSYEQMVEIKHRLTELHGSPRNWSAETTQDTAPFIALLPKAELNILAEKFPDIILQVALKTTRPVSPTKELLSARFESVRNSSILVRAPGLTPDCVEVHVPSSDEMIKLSEANMFWSVQELVCMDADTFTKAVELLGCVKGFNASQLITLKEKAKQVWGPFTSWKSYHVVSMGRIATALNESEIEELDLSSIDTVAALSLQTEWSPGQAKSIVHGFLGDSGQTVDTLKSFDLAGLGANLCALNATEVEAIQPEEFSAVVARIGSLPCSTSVLKAFKKIAESVFGNVAGWNGFILQEIGTIAAGLTADEFKALGKELMPYFQPAAIKYIPDDVFQELSPEQIANLGPENAAWVTKSQRQRLDELQLQSLQLALDGARTNIQEASLGKTTPGPMYTSLQNCAPFSSSVTVGLCAGFILQSASWLGIHH